MKQLLVLKLISGQLEENILIKPAEVFKVKGKKIVCRLKKSLYILKQSSRQWYKRFSQCIISHGHIKSPNDSCVYHSKVEDGSYIYMFLYVDDKLIASQEKSEIQKLNSLFRSEFEMKNIGAAKKILGEIRRDHAQNKFFLCQKEYIQKVLNRFRMTTTKSVCTHLVTSIRLSKLNATRSKLEKEYMSHVSYVSAVRMSWYA